MSVGDTTVALALCVSLSVYTLVGRQLEGTSQT